FSSRRRHTRWPRDWSSDVCSSDLERFRWREAAALTEPLRQRAEAWAAAALKTLRQSRPALPHELDDRAQDGWEPLLAIADLAARSEEHTSELQSRGHLVCRLLLEK